MVDDSASQIAGAKKNRLEMIVKSENAAKLVSELRYVVAVALLSEAAEARESLPYLGGGGSHLFGKRLRGYAVDAVVFQFKQKPVIMWKPPHH